MKTKEKEFRIYDKERPKVLLLGNGLCRAYGGVSWDRFLDELKDSTVFPHPADKYILPMPLKAALLANNNLSTNLRNIVKEGNISPGNSPDTRINWSSFVHTTEEMRTQLRKLISCGFDYVLTTNYSYEIEAALLGAETLSPKEIAKLMNFHEVDNAQTQFLINTYNQVGDVPVWHVHGEARKPKSMILSHYYYGKILRRCIARLDGTKEITEDNRPAYIGKEKEFTKNIKVKRPQKIGSWIDAFVLGDVYILGFGMDFSEADLWWLVEYKHNHPEFSGKTVFYNPRNADIAGCAYDRFSSCAKLDDYIHANQCRTLLLREIYDVQIETLDTTIYQAADYKVFYNKGIEDIEKGNALR